MSPVSPRRRLPNAARKGCQSSAARLMRPPTAPRAMRTSNNRISVPGWRDRLKRQCHRVERGKLLRFSDGRTQPPL